MIIAFGCDHAGFKLKRKIVDFLDSRNCKVIDCGCFSEEGCDYPDFAIPVAEYVSRKKCDMGILVCGTGAGMSMSANRIPGVRAALCYSDEVARLVRDHNDANILCLPARTAPTAGENDLVRWIEIFIDTPFSNEPRHRKRIEKIDTLSKKYCKR